MMSFAKGVKNGQFLVLDTNVKLVMIKEKNTICVSSVRMMEFTMSIHCLPHVNIANVHL